MSMEWRNIPDFLGKYSASSEGLIRNNETGRILSPSLKRTGYLQVVLRKNKIRVSLLVHRAVASSFGLPIENRQINHKDGDKQNNKIDNLEAVTASGNVHHAFTSGLKSKQLSQRETGLTVEDILFIRENYKPRHQSLGQNALALKYKVSQSVISRIFNKRNYKEI